MKKIFILICILFTSFSFINAEDIDTSILDEINKLDTKELNLDFKLKSFSSCENLESIMWEYIKNYYKNHNFYKHDMIYDEGVDNISELRTSISADEMSNKNVKLSSITDKSNLWWNEDYSKTNIQVKWVDESDIIKTDWKYIYYYNEEHKYIYIIDSVSSSVLKKIAVPNSFYNISLYIHNNKLVVLSSSRINSTYKNINYIDKNNKTYTIVYDISDKSNPKLEKLYLSDWELSQSRMIWKYLYVISNNNFSSFYNFYDKNSSDLNNIKIDLSSIMPRKIELSKTLDISKQNLKIKWKKLNFNIKSENIAKCNEIEYFLPDKESLKNIDFNPSYNIISIINVEDTQEEVKSKLILANSSEIHMSLNNLYLVDSIYTSYNYKCPLNLRCISPYYYWWVSNTLVHKLNIEDNNLKYQSSNILPWTPLTQYSMDEKDDYFRIITSIDRNWKESKHSDLYILDKDLKLISSLKNLWEWENFKSSRFMGDKLFLVTFEEIDPLFVIDLIDQKNPKILWELKMPWYSTYLHPYDENHIIWLWFDTNKNKYEWVMNWWLKIDLYEINYDKKEKSSNNDYIEVKQKFTKTIWDIWSSSEATNNPRMFMWNESKKLLFLPASIYTKFSLDDYRNKDFFQWLIAFKIDKDSWIDEKYRISHFDYKKIEDARLEECKKYFIQNDESEKCVKLINGKEYCPKNQTYIPTYCYKNTEIWEYIANNPYIYQNLFVKRALWIADNVFSISDTKIIKSDIFTWNSLSNINMIK